MKRIIIFIWALFAINPLLASQSNTCDTDQGVDIPVNKKNPDPLKGKPRSIVDNDIEATYHMGALTLVFNTDLGDADIIVCNLNTGDVWSGGVSGMGIETILLSGDEGYYTITIYTDNGEYYGEMWL